MSDFLEKVQAALNPDWVIQGKEKKQLREDRENQVITIRAGGIPYFLFQLDQNQPFPFPFFNQNISKLTIRCDYLLFAKDNGQNKIFILAIELKTKGERKAIPQIVASKRFSKYLFESIAEVQNIGLQPVFRGISCIPGGKSTNLVHYKNDIAVNGGKELYLKRFLK